jgi:hypothetical protein
MASGKLSKISARESALENVGSQFLSLRHYQILGLSLSPFSRSE